MSTIKFINVLTQHKHKVTTGLYYVHNISGVMRSLVAVAAGPIVPCPGLHAPDDGLPALPGLGAGHQPLQRPRPVPLLLQLPHRPQQLLPELNQLLLQPLDLAVEVFYSLFGH